MKDPIFILGCTKSGTTLMRNLFDGHPDLFIVPFESHFFQITHKWVSYYFRRTNPHKLTFDEMKLGLFNWVKYMNTISNTIADGFIQGQLDILKFKEYIDNEKVSNTKELSNAYIKAIYYSLLQKEMPTNIRFVEKSVENVEFCQEWIQMYPNAKFIHILRNPYSNIVAIRKYLAKTKKKYPFLLPAFSAMNTSYYFLYKNPELIKNYKVIRYEDLLVNPERAMKELSVFLDIEFSKVLLTPSHLNELWKGNSTNRQNFSGVSAGNIKKWEVEITDYEINMINKYFDFVIKDFNFGFVKPLRSIYWPQKSEGVKNYIRNRFLENIYK